MGATNRNWVGAFRVCAALGASAVALQIVWSMSRIGGVAGTTAFSDLIGLVSLLAGVACFVRAASETGTGRRAWRLLGGGSVSWGIGQAIWSWYELVAEREVPFPSLADVGFLGLIPFAVGALLTFPSAPDDFRGRVRRLLDGCTAAVAFFIVIWRTVLGPIYGAREGTLLEQALALAYPAGDVILIVIVVFALYRARGSGGASLVLVATGIVALAVADGGFAYLTSIDAYHTGSLIDTGWTAGFILIGLGALRRDGAAATGADSHGSRAYALMPYAFVFAAILVVCWRQLQFGAVGPVIVWGGLALVACVAARQWLTTLDNLAFSRRLEVMVQERTAELRTALAELSVAKQLQDAFVANASHELRTPLTGILGAVRTMYRSEAGMTPTLRPLADIAQRGAVRMSRLIEDLLLASGLTGGLSLDARPADAVDAVRAAVEEVRAKGRAVTMTGEDSVPALLDVDRLRFVLGHLLDNAHRFAPDVSAVGVSVAVLGSHVEIRVTDAGPGVPADQRDRIFDRFYQVDGSATRTHAGAGLGLYVSRHVARLMGGDLRLEEGRPTTFVLVAPTGPPAPPTGGVGILELGPPEHVGSEPSVSSA